MTDCVSVSGGRERERENEEEEECTQQTINEERSEM